MLKRSRFNVKTTENRINFVHQTDKSTFYKFSGKIQVIFVCKERSGIDPKNKRKFS